jgi:hypothetical protein
LKDFYTPAKVKPFESPGKAGGLLILITRIPSGIFATLLSIISSHLKLSFSSIGRFFLLL